MTPLAAQQPQANPQPSAQQQTEAAPTPEMFWNALLTGNKQFVAGKLTYDKLAEERRLLANSQYPPMTILSCSDSRVPPELVFNQSLGALFIMRTAGNVADTLGIASIEYAITQNWTMLLVVLAHEDCGAVKASMGQGDPTSPNLLALATRIRGSFYGIEWDPNNPVAVRRATIANARASAASLLAQSAIIRQAVADGKVKIIVAYYSTATGVVERVD
ncbi:MAG TPA: carbonic anhydrase [Thermoanaerobaculia bacterium]|nr:carbonic anhydrase [Thermoanaerobaculia bacterium]